MYDADGDRINPSKAVQDQLNRLTTRSKLLMDALATFSRRMDEQEAQLNRLQAALVIIETLSGVKLGLEQEPTEHI